ncbi:hypothetical protein [Halorussus salinus]|uniref:hypothetical protein n=1 Tax=Halorussus salinus TaxID=1364935 RepID=UPI00109269F3|nr:hypothetical protein [Halorussus salinus]
MSLRTNLGDGEVAVLMLLLGIGVSVYSPPLGELIFEIGVAMNLGIPDAATYLPDIAELRSQGEIFKTISTYLFMCVAGVSIVRVLEKN